MCFDCRLREISNQFPKSLLPLLRLRKDYLHYFSGHAHHHELTLGVNYLTAKVQKGANFNRLSEENVVDVDQQRQTFTKG